MSAEAQKLLVKMHTYRVAGVLFTIIGLFIFSYNYTEMADGSFFELFQKPVVMLWLIAPFIPASLIFFLYGRLEKKLSRLLEQTDKSA